MHSKSTLLSILVLITWTVGLEVHSDASDAPVELLVKWKDGPESPAAAEANFQIGSAVKRNFNEIGWQQVQLPDGISVRAGLEAYLALGTVLAVEPNAAYRINPLWSARAVSTEADRSVGRHGPQPPPVIPNDPRFGQQWYLKKIGATNAWATTTGSTNIVVAVIDTGVDYTHPDLAPNMWRNPGETGLDVHGHDKATNGIDDDDNGYVDDVHGIDTVDGTGDPMDTGYFVPPAAPFYHGTFCAGIIGAVGNNSTGIAGVNWSVQIMAVRHYGDLSKYTDESHLSQYLAAWDYVIKMKRRGVNIRVTNNSEYSNGFSEALRDAIAAAGNEGVLNVCIAGNEPGDQDLLPISFPGAYDERSVLSVAASTESDNLTDFSGFGRSTVDLAAPGINIISTVKGGGYLSGGYGTSFACPQVAGAAALLLAADANLTVDQLKAALFGSADQPSSMKGKLLTNGRLNVARAIESLTNANPPCIVIYASPVGRRTPANAPIQVTFNRPMNRASVEGAFVIQPPVDGAFEWSADSRSFSFRHDELFDASTNYTVRILGSAQEDGGASLDGNFNRTLEGSPADDFVWNLRFPISNDDFMNAQELVGAIGSVSANDRYATGEFFEGNHAGASTGASVWYRWSPPDTGGWFTFDLTDGTAFDAVLAMYTGDNLNRRTEVAGNDNYGSKPGSRVSFAALAGTNYSIVVASKAASVADLINPAKSGNFKLAWYPTPPPSFAGTQFSPTVAVPGSKITFAGTNFTGTTSVLFNGASASFTNAAGNNLDLRITAVVPPDASSGPVTVVTPHGNVTSTVSFTVLPPPLTVRLISTNELDFTWPATSTAIVLEVSETLGADSWTPVAQLPRTENGQSKITLVAPAGNRFYRLTTR